MEEKKKFIFFQWESSELWIIDLITQMVFILAGREKWGQLISLKVVMCIYYGQMGWNNMNLSLFFLSHGSGLVF